MLHGGYNKDVKEIDFDDYVHLTNEELQEINETDLLTIVPVIKNKYNYKYQGQERQDELGLNWDSFKWRNYDYAIGRFFNIDPLAEEYSYQSPYNFAENRVVDGRELEGLEWVDANGNKIYDPNLQNEDGSRGGYTQFASQQDIDYGNGLRNSGETGDSKFNQLVNSELPISVEFNNEATSGFAGITNPVLDDSDLLAGFFIIIWTKTSDEVVLNPDERLHSVEAKLVKDGNITSFEYSISTFGHEIDHATKANYEQNKRQEKTGIINQRDNSETEPTKTGRKILKEIGENKE